MLQHMCVGYLCVYIYVLSCMLAFLFLWCPFAGSRGVFLKLQTSLKESKSESWERRRGVKEGQRGVSEKRTEIK